MSNNVYRTGPQGSAVPLTREQRLERALGEIRSCAEAWADPEAGDAILALLDRLDLPAQPYPQLTVDHSVGAAYVYLRHIGAGGVKHTKELGHGILADFDGDGKLIGVEIL